MLNLNNNENDAVFDGICKKSKNSNSISKNEGYFFGKHLLVGNSPTATALYINEFLAKFQLDQSSRSRNMSYLIKNKSEIVSRL